MDGCPRRIVVLFIAVLFAGRIAAAAPPYYSGSVGNGASTGGRLGPMRPILFEPRRPRDVVLVSGRLEAPVAVAPGGEVVYVSDDGVVARVEHDGHQRWSFLVGLSRGAPAVDGDGNTYVAGRDGMLYALDASGGLRWSRPLGGLTNYALAVEREAVVSALDTGEVVWWRRRDGAFEGIAAMGVAASGAPVLAADGRAFVPAVDGSVVGVSPSHLLFRARVGGHGRASPLAVGGAGELYVGTSDGAVACVTSEGRVTWRTNVGGAVTRSPVLAEDGSVYAAAGGDLVKLSSGGALLWRRALGVSIVGGPLVADDGSVLVTGVEKEPRDRSDREGRAEERRGVVLRTHPDGEPGAMLPLPEPPTPGLSLDQHELWVAFPDLTLRRLRVPERALAHSSWPKARGGVTNSGVPSLNVAPRRDPEPPAPRSRTQLLPGSG